MLPKIVVGWQKSLTDFADLHNLPQQKILTFDGASATIDELRDWLFFCGNLTSTDSQYIVLLQNADKLSLESQSILLKPLEEKKPDVFFFLLVSSESGLLSTVVSRCEVSLLGGDKRIDKYWSIFMSLMKSSPGEIVTFCETMKDADVEEFVTEMVSRMSLEIKNMVSQKRVLILKVLLDALVYLPHKGINKRLLLENLLFETWRVVKT